MKRVILPILLLLSLSMYVGCAPPAKFQRIGSPGDFIVADNKVILLSGHPSTSVDISVTGRNVGSWFGQVATAIGTRADHNINQGVLDALIKNDLPEYTQNTIVAALSEILSTSNRLQIADKILLLSSPEDSKRQKGEIPASADLFAVDSHVSFIAVPVQSDFAAALGAFEGMAITLTVRFNYLSSGTEKKKIWDEIFVCDLETIPLSENLIENEAFRAKQLVKKAIDRLKPWISKELQPNTYDKYQRIRVKYRSHLKDEGWLLQDSNDLLVIRVIEGTTKIVPKQYIREMKVIQ